MAENVYADTFSWRICVIQVCNSVIWGPRFTKANLKRRRSHTGLSFRLLFRQEALVCNVSLAVSTAQNTVKMAENINVSSCKSHLVDLRSQNNALSEYGPRIILSLSSQVKGGDELFFWLMVDIDTLSC